ncbi:MAG: hypothetical protein VB050_18230 [Geobacteraceae bacterium]|nr:hypothetical protein [Geobacteraceae bacterium]
MRDEGSEDRILEVFDKEAFNKMKTMSPEQKLSLIKAALYSDEHILKILVKVMFIADPGGVNDVLSWLKNRRV